MKNIQKRKTINFKLPPDLANTKENENERIWAAIRGPIFEVFLHK